LEVDESDAEDRALENECGGEGSAVESKSSGPAMVSRRKAQSATEEAMGPTVSRLEA
jgi:hypothetical protein